MMFSFDLHLSGLDEDTVRHDVNISLDLGVGG